ncbi:MAG: gamma-glutamyltransferase [Rubrivivax sp.]|nr:gamma-glutamyltransferase [Rubrivivax sp.]
MDIGSPLKQLKRLFGHLFAASALVLGGCALAPPAERAAAAAGAPMAATAHPLATRAALAMMARGGSAVDAAIAAQMVLGLVEPQSSGLGGGTLALHWEAATGQLTSLDALAAAPAQATAGLAIDVDGSVLSAEVVRRGGRSVGVPGTLALFDTLHSRLGKLVWATLFEPAIDLAEQGFAMPRYLHDVLAAAPPGAVNAELRALYFGAGGQVLPVGTPVRHPAYADTLRQIAAQGARGWLEGGAARAIAAAAQQGAKPSLMTEADVRAYRAEPREPLCGPLLRWRVCVMGPSSYGGLAVLQMLQIVQASVGSAGHYDFDDPEFVHRFVEAGRLAQADRLRYAGDPGFVTLPLRDLLDAAYLRERAQRIAPERAMTEAPAGVFPHASVALAQEAAVPADATSQIAIVDAAGNALSVTTTINLNFGSWLTVGGFVLNNAMTNFAPAPPPGQTCANQMAPGKRPVTSMTPTIVFDERNVPVVVGGSAGGGQIVDYVAASLIEMLAAGRSPAQALSRGHVSSAVAGTVQLEQGTGAQALAAALQAKGHRVSVTEMKSGLAFLKREGALWVGAADPRRDGSAAALAR